VNNMKNRKNIKAGEKTCISNAKIDMSKAFDQPPYSNLLVQFGVIAYIGVSTIGFVTAVN